MLNIIKLLYNLDSKYGLFLLLSNRIHLITLFLLYSRFLLVISFIHISVYMSIPIAQFIPPPPLPPTAFPPWCPYICSLHLCLYSCLANRFICTIFLDSTYNHLYTIFVFLTYFTLYDSLQVHPRLYKTQFVPFYGRVIFLCIYVPHLLYPFVC